MLLISALSVIAIDVSAGPLVIEESAKLTAPDPTYDQWPVSAAIDGDWIIATGKKEFRPEESSSFREYSAWLYRRQSTGTWQLVRPLVQVVLEDDPEEPRMIVDMHGGIAAITKESRAWVFARSANDWIEEPSTISGDGADVEVDAGTIAVTAGHCDWIVRAYRKAADGVWRLVRETPGEAIDCENEDNRGDVAISGNRLIVSTFGTEATAPEPRIDSARIFEGPFGAPATMTRLNSPTGERGFGSPVALESVTALAGHTPEGGLYAFTRNGLGNWPVTGTLLRHDILAVGPGGLVDLRGSFAVNADAVFSRNADGTFDYVARLLPSDGFVPQRPKVSGRRIVGVNATARAVYVFELPSDLTQPPTALDDFEDGSASDWTPIAGSSFTVVATAASRVFRQSSVAGDAGAILRDTDRHNQAVQADISPLRSRPARGLDGSASRRAMRMRATTTT
jgi:hypothetical protein